MTAYRSWEEREADAKRTRAEADKLAAETARIAAEAKAAEQAAAAKGETDELAEELKRTKLRQQINAVAESGKDADRERKAKRREERADSGLAYRVAVTVSVTFGLLGAFPAQILYFLGLGPAGETAWTMLPVPMFLELLAWTSVLGTAWAHRKHLPRLPFWIMTGALASIAGTINAVHGYEAYGLVGALGLAACSVLGPAMWEVRQWLVSRSAADPRSDAQRAAAKRAEAEQRAADKRERKQDEERAEHFTEQYERYVKILAHVPAGTLSRDEAWAEADLAVKFPEVYARYEELLAFPGAPARPVAWADAWRDVEGGPVGVTADVLGRRLTAEEKLAAVLAEAERTPERVAVELLLADLFPARDGGDEGPLGGPSDGDPKGGPQGGSQSRTALGRKGKQGTGRTSAKVPDKPLDEADLDAVRKLAETLGGADKLSVRKIRTEAGVGGADAYLVRLRDAVQATR